MMKKEMLSMLDKKVCLGKVNVSKTVLVLGRGEGKASPWVSGLGEARRLRACLMPHTTRHSKRKIVLGEC
jgi:hypothetical protein